MSIEYQKRGVLHKLTSTKKFRPQQSKHALIKWAAKSALAAETTVLFAKDLTVNRFVGKETHIKFERRQNSHGKFRTHVKLVRAEATNRPSGLLHKAFGAGRFFEGDKPFQKNPTTKYKPKSVKGEIVYGALGSSKAVLKKSAKLAKATALSGETVLMKAGSTGLRQIRYKLRNSSDMHDSGKAVMTGVTALQTLNRGRKYLINYRRSRKNYKQLKSSFAQQKQQLASAKVKYKGEKQKYKLEKKRLKNKLNGISSDTSVGQKKRIVLKSKVRYQKQLNRSNKAVYKNLKKQKKFAKKEAKSSKVIPIAALPLVPSAAAAKQLTSTYARKAVYADTNNDFMQAAEKAVRGANAVNRATKPVRSKLHQKHTESQRNKLQTERNRLTSKNTDLKKNQRKHTKKKQPTKKASEKAKEAAKKTAKKAKKAAGNFAKLAVRILGALLLPILLIIFVFIVIMLMFTGVSDNSSYILGTYNAKDKDISKAIECYTEIAYDYNCKVIQCGNADTWKNGLRSLGVSVSTLSSYTDTPNHFTFGKSGKFTQTPSYDFDPDKLAAFMCAYFYEPDSNGNVKNWEWKDEYEDVLQELFDTEYSFAHYYEDYSGWKQLNKFQFYEGGGAHGHSYYSVYFEDFSKGKIKIRAVPSDISQFCKDGYLNYSYSTLEILDANNANKRTGYFIQDQRYTVTDPSGQSHQPFYRTTAVTRKEVADEYADSDGAIHYNTSSGIVYNNSGEETNYYIKNVHASPFSYRKYVWEKTVSGELKNVNRSGWIWNSDKTQIFCAVTPWDTYEWNNTLHGVCLIDFYRKNYWYDDCTLYYTVKKNCTFEKAIEKVIKNKHDNTQARLDFYQVLTEANEQGHQTYGNHQMMNAPTGGKSLKTLISGNKIHNKYGYDMQEWNKTHCSDLTDVHKGMDIAANNGDKVYAMFDGKIEEINSSKQTIRIKTTSDMDFWYCDNKKYPVEAIYTNVKATVNEGDSVKQGQVIGKVTSKKRCFDDLNIKSSKNYLHITIKVFDDWFGAEVDPWFLIYRNDKEAK